MYSVEVRRKVIEFIDSLPNSNLIRNKIRDLQKFKGKERLNLDIEKIRGAKKNQELFRLRIGEIRFIFQVLKSEKIIWIKAADYRGRIYK
ncbi:MAG: hypothetical protein KJ879_02950 [Nanoarchaeota archaeon]|nr:hypothetical protein [Nanoarchaeota archaeon]